MDCYFSTDTPQFTRVPHLLTCQCRGDSETFSWSVVEMVEDDLIPSILNVVIANCSTLFINLTHTQRDLSMVPNLTISKADEVFVELSSELSPQFIKFLNVTQVHTTLVEVEQVSLENFYLLLCAILGGVLFVVLLSLPLLCWCVRRKTSQDELNKKVSRAESWRYESSMYVNPTNPGRPQLSLLPHTQMRVNSTSPLLSSVRHNSSISPLPDAVIGIGQNRIDIIRPTAGIKRTSVSSPQSRHRMAPVGTPPPLPGLIMPAKFRGRAPVAETDRFYDDTDNSSDDQANHSESGNYGDNHQASTLPHR